MDTPRLGDGGAARSVAICVAELKGWRPIGLAPLLDITRRQAEMLGLTCIVLVMKKRVLFTLTGGNAALDVMQTAMTKSRWHQDLSLVGDRFKAPPFSLRRSAVRPILLASEQDWLDQELDRDRPRTDIMIALMDWIVMRDLERALGDGGSDLAPFPGLSRTNDRHTLQ